jgi:hypothetical protein
LQAATAQDGCADFDSSGAVGVEVRSHLEAQACSSPLSPNSAL